MHWWLLKCLLLKIYECWIHTLVFGFFGFFNARKNILKIFEIEFTFLISLQNNFHFPKKIYISLQIMLTKINDHGSDGPCKNVPKHSKIIDQITFETRILYETPRLLVWYSLEIYSKKIAIIVPKIIIKKSTIIANRVYQKLSFSS